MIKSFREKHTEKLWKEKTDRRWKNIQEVALRKLEQLNKAKSLFDLASPASNHLETLRGEWKGYHSIRINNQWRIIFIWEKKNAYEVAIVDYH